MKTVSEKIKILLCLAVLMIITFTVSVFEVTVYADTEGYILVGDANEDEVVNANDALKLLRIAAKLEEMDNRFSIRKNDLTGDYQVDAEDALRVLLTAAKLNETKTIDDPADFYDNYVEYQDGYPLYDYLGAEVDGACAGVTDSVDPHLHTPLERWRLLWGSPVFYQCESGEETRRLLKDGKLHETTFDRVYWNARWLLEDGLADGKFEETGVNAVPDGHVDGFFSGIEGADSMDVVWLWLSRKTMRGLDSSSNYMHANLHVYVTESDELYLAGTYRTDFFREEDNMMLFKYTGEIPEALRYESLSAAIESLGSPFPPEPQQNQKGEQK